MSFPASTVRILTAMTAAATLLVLPAESTAGPSLGALNQQLGQQRAQQQTLQSSVNRLNGLISSLTAQISLVRSREAAVQAQLSHDQTQLAATQTQLQLERRLLALLKARLAKARRLLSAQLVSNYESGGPDLVGVVLQSNGFSDLLERITFLKDAELEQQNLI